MRLSPVRGRLCPALHSARSAPGHRSSCGAPAFPAARRGSSSRLHARLDRILDVLDLVDLDIEQLACDFLYTPDIDRLDDVARLRIDRNRPAGALPLHALGCADQGMKWES